MYDTESIGCVRTYKNYKSTYRQEFLLSLLCNQWEELCVGEYAPTAESGLTFLRNWLISLIFFDRAFSLVKQL